ncbi:MAG TPA: hypothetical protein VIM14_06730, partial [Polyangia bacterium]
DLGAVIARIGSVPIFAKQVEAEAKRTGKSNRLALEDLIAADLLAEHAKRAGFTLADSKDQDIQNALVQRLIERDVEPNLLPTSTPDSALRPLWERARDTFVHPRLVEVGVLGVFTGAEMEKEERKEREQTAKELAAFVRSHPAPTLEDFAAFAHDPAWSARHVVFRRMLQGLDTPLSKAVGTEVAKLRTSGDTTPLVVDKNGGFIARYVDEQPPGNITFEQVRGKLLAGFYEHWRLEQFLDYTSKFARLHRVETHFDRLSTNEHGL